MKYLEVAQITSDAETGDRVVRYKVKGNTRTIDATSPLMEPLCYPLFFNLGEQGWGSAMKKDNHIEFQSYLACRLLRPEPSLLLEDGHPVNRFQVFSRLGKYCIEPPRIYKNNTVYLYIILRICRTNIFC